MTNETKDTASPKSGQATKIEALEALLVKVQAGDESVFHFAKVYPVGCKKNDWMHAAHNGSLDAANALHEAVLGVRFNYSIQKDRASVMTWAHTIEGKIISAESSNPARAWLIALLKALIWEAKQ